MFRALGKNHRIGKPACILRNIDTLVLQYLAGKGEPLCGVVIAGNDKYRRIGTILPYPCKKPTEKRNRLRRRNGAVIHIACDNQRCIVVPCKDIVNVVQHFFLHTEQRRFVQRFSQMQIGGMEQFHLCYCMTNIRFCKGAG